MRSLRINPAAVNREGELRRFDNLHRISRLDPERDYAEIYRLMVFHEFPWDLRMAGKLMIWHLFAVPSTARVVGSTDALTARAEETSLVFGDLIEHGLDSPTGRDIVRLINRSHRGWDISIEDHRYALAALAVTAVRWLDRHGWRRPSAAERTAIAVFYAELGRRIGVAGVSRRYDDLATYVADCESRRIAHSPEGRQVSERTVAMTRSRTPWPFTMLVRPVIAALLDPAVRSAVGLTAPRLPVRCFLAGLLYARPRIVRNLPPRAVATTPRTRRRLPEHR